MAPRIIIERLECYGRCGVTEEERGKPQLIAIDVELEAAVDAAGLSDRLDETIDYARVAERLVALNGSRSTECSFGSENSMRRWRWSPAQSVFVWTGLAPRSRQDRAPRRF